MAAPENKNVRDLNGKWTINKTLSDNPDPVLALQGIGWLIRKAAGLATVTQTVTTYTDDKGTAHVDISQSASGLKPTVEERAFDWQERSSSNWLFGDVVGKSRYTTFKDLLAEPERESERVIGNGWKGKGKDGDKGRVQEDAEWLAKDWLPESADGEIVESYVENPKIGWTGWQVWGFADVEVEGVRKRWHTRRFVVRKGEETIRVVLRYDWAGEA